MRSPLLSPRATLGVVIATVVALATALAMAMPALSVGAADAGARSLLASRSGEDTGIDLSLPRDADPQAQNAKVREVIAATFPTRASVAVDAVETTGLVDAGGRRAYLAADIGETAPLPLAAGRWPGGPAEAAIPASLAESWGVGVGDTIALGSRTVTIAGVWRASAEAADRWFGVRDEFARSGGAGPVLVTPDVLDAVAEDQATDRRVHWTVRPRPDDLDLATLTASVRAGQSLPDAVAAAGVATDDVATTGRLLPTAQLASARAAVLGATEPLALASALLTALAVLVVFAVLVVGATAAERRLRWARGAPAPRIVAGEAIRWVVPGAIGAAVGAVGVLAATPDPGPLVPTAAMILLAGTLAPGLLVALLVSADVRALHNTDPAVGGSPRWAVGVAASVFVLAAALSAARLLSLGSPLGPARGTATPDPIAVAAPAAVLLALVGILVVVPVLGLRRGWERLARRGGASRMLWAMRVARRPLAVTASAMLVGAAIGQLGIAAVYQSSWGNAYASALAAQEGTAYRVATDASDLTSDALARLAASPGIAGVAPVWSEDTSIAARPASVIMAAPAAIAALGDPAVGDLGRLVDASRGDAPGPILPTAARTVRVDVAARGTAAVADALILEDAWARTVSVSPGPEGGFSLPPVSAAVGGAWRLAAVELALTGTGDAGGQVSLTSVTVDGEPVDLGSLVLPVDVSTDALALQADPGPPVAVFDSATTRVRFVPVGPVPPAVVSRAFADAAGVDEGDTLPLSLTPDGRSSAVRIAVVVTAIPGAPSDSAVFLDATVVVADRLTAQSALPSTDDAWLALVPGTSPDEIAAALPDDGRLSGTAADDGRGVLAAAVTMLWWGAAGMAVLALVGLAAAGAVVRRSRVLEAASLRAAGMDAVARRRLRIGEQIGAVLAGVVAGAVAAAVTAVTLLPAMVTGALPKPVAVAVVVDPWTTGIPLAAFSVAALAVSLALAVRDDARAREAMQ
ncbi:hypothetical protein [Microbacterium sp. 1P10AE]|uniref:hypothetical protein n=1 Tax=Microbacterium sp. 1P10AE TaxID=3132286 RepID=UPI00399F47C2